MCLNSLNAIAIRIVRMVTFSIVNSQHPLRGKPYVPSTSWGDWSTINKNRKASSDPELSSHLAHSFEKLSLDTVKFDRKNEVVSTPLGTDNSRGLEHRPMPNPDTHIEATGHASGSLVSTKPKRFISRLDHRIGGGK